MIIVTKSHEPPSNTETIARFIVIVVQITKPRHPGQVWCATVYRSGRRIITELRGFSI